MMFHKTLKIFVVKAAIVLFMFNRCGSLFGQDPVNIEIIAGGRRYGSLEEYKSDHRSAVKRFRHLSDKKDRQISLFNVVDDAITKVYRSLPVTGDLPRFIARDIDKYLNLKLEHINSRDVAAGLYDPFLDSYRRISHLGFNTGVARIVEDFKRHAGQENFYKRLLARDLERTLRGSIEGSGYSGPVLIISHQKKLRIMTLGSQSPSISDQTP